jgi:hypothetical protein
MNALTILALFLIAWGALTLLVGLLRPRTIWKMGKLQGFVQLLGETGTVILLVGLGLAAIGGGIWLLFQG